MAPSGFRGGKMPQPYRSPADEMVERVVAEYNRHLERACWVSLLDPKKRGIRVDVYDDRRVITLDADVPWVTIEEYQHYGQIQPIKGDSI